MHTHGGARRRAGRKTEIDDRVHRATFTIDERTAKLLRILGEGNASRGLRAAAEVAYEQYLKK